MTLLPDTPMSPAFPLSWNSAALDGGTVLVTLAGELDGNTAPGLRAHLEWLLAGTCRRLVLDSGAVTFADLAAYELLREIGQRASDRGCEVVLADPGQHLVRFVALLGAPPGVTVDRW
jgi:stage II sporulation protein AA (anti-sigma F factor antagonist)